VKEFVSCLLATQILLSPSGSVGSFFFREEVGAGGRGLKGVGLPIC
jgi:hypothetical protein